MVYKDYLDEKGIPKAHGMSLAPYFSKTLWEGKYPPWQDYDTWRSLGLPELQAGDSGQNAIPASTPKECRT